MQINYGKILKQVESPYILRMFVIFVFLSSALGLLFGLILSFRMNSFLGLKWGISAAIIVVLFGLGVSLLIEIAEKVKCYVKYGSIDFKVHQERRFLIEDDYSKAFNKLSHILQELKNTDITRKDFTNGLLKAETKWSWRSYGEVIGIKLSPAAGRVRVFLTSSPKLPTNIIDFSKNFENVQLIVEGLKKGREYKPILSEE